MLFIAELYFTPLYSWFNISNANTFAFVITFAMTKLLCEKMLKKSNVGITYKMRRKITIRTSKRHSKSPVELTKH